MKKFVKLVLVFILLANTANSNSSILVRPAVANALDHSTSVSSFPFSAEALMLPSRWSQHSTHQFPESEKSWQIARGPGRHIPTLGRGFVLTVIFLLMSVISFGQTGARNSVFDEASDINSSNSVSIVVTTGNEFQQKFTSLIFPEQSLFSEEEIKTMQQVFAIMYSYASTRGDATGDASLVALADFLKNPTSRIYLIACHLSEIRDAHTSKSISTTNTVDGMVWREPFFPGKNNQSMYVAVDPVIFNSKYGRARALTVFLKEVGGRIVVALNRNENSLTFREAEEKAYDFTGRALDGIVKAPGGRFENPVSHEIVTLTDEEEKLVKDVAMRNQFWWARHSSGFPDNPAIPPQWPEPVKPPVEPASISKNSPRSEDRYSVHRDIPDSQLLGMPSAPRAPQPPVRNNVVVDAKSGPLTTIRIPTSKKNFDLGIVLDQNSQLYLSLKKVKTEQQVIDETVNLLKYFPETITTNDMWNILSILEQFSDADPRNHFFHNKLVGQLLPRVSTYINTPDGQKNLIEVFISNAMQAGTNLKPPHYRVIPLSWALILQYNPTAMIPYGSSLLTALTHIIGILTDIPSENNRWEIDLITNFVTRIKSIESMQNSPAITADPNSLQVFISHPRHHRRVLLIAA